MIKLVIRQGPQMGMELLLDRPSVRIGRGPGNDLILEDGQASRNHAEISQQGGQFYIRDMGSMNGTLVNNRRVTASQLLQTGDRIQIGDTVLACEAAPAMAPAYEADWESGLYTDQTAVPGGQRRNRILIWGLVAVVAVLAIAVAVALFLMLRSPEPAPPVVVEPTLEPTVPSVVVATATAEPPAAPTSTQLVALPTVEPVPTVKVESTLPAAQPPSAPVSAPAVPVSPADLEKLPQTVTQFLGEVPPDQLPQVIAQQMQTLQPEQMQAMIEALFPGAGLNELPKLVAASFPGLEIAQIEGLLDIAFPGQTVKIPEAGPVGGRLVLGIYDQGRNQYDLYIAGATGGQPTLLAENATNPSFSPDGQYIVYQSMAPERAGLRIMRTDGTDDKALTEIASDRNPKWSPDGQLILFANVDNNTLHVVNQDGTNRRSLGHGEFPDWNEDGTRIVYRGCVGGGCGLVVANADGSNPRQITKHANDTMPAWGSGVIAFGSDRDGNWEIYVINPDGTWLRRITLVAATDIMPVWDPSGWVRLAFRSDRGGDPAIYVTSGIGGGDFKQFSAASGPEWMLAGMDWGE